MIWWTKGSGDIRLWCIIWYFIWNVENGLIRFLWKFGKSFLSCLIKEIFNYPDLLQNSMIPAFNDPFKVCMNPEFNDPVYIFRSLFEAIVFARWPPSAACPRRTRPAMRMRLMIWIWTPSSSSHITSITLRPIEWDIMSRKTSNFLVRIYSRVLYCWKSMISSNSNKAFLTIGFCSGKWIQSHH